LGYLQKKQVRVSLIGAFLREREVLKVFRVLKGRFSGNQGFLSGLYSEFSLIKAFYLIYAG
jgi:hypothetical protein